MTSVQQLISIVQVVEQIEKHTRWEWHHHPAVEWLYDARETSPKTCERCMRLHLTEYTGDQIEDAFPYHTHYRVNIIRPMVHPYCRCRLHYVGGKTDIPEDER